MINDTEIMRRLRMEDTSVLTVILREIVPTLWPLLTRHFREALSHEDVEEVVAESLAKLWKNRNSFDSSKGEFCGWMFTILRNSALDLLRKRRPRQDETLVLVRFADASPSTTLEQRDVLKTAWSNLSQREQEVLVPLFDRSGVSIADLSQSLSLSHGAVRQLRFRALRKLERQLAQAGYGLQRVRTQPDS